MYGVPRGSQEKNVFIEFGNGKSFKPNLQIILLLKLGIQKSNM